jgi:hypothetical protein
MGLGGIPPGIGKGVGWEGRGGIMAAPGDIRAPGAGALAPKTCGMRSFRIWITC